MVSRRAKYANPRREPWAALHLAQADFAAYAVIEANVERTPARA